MTRETPEERIQRVISAAFEAMEAQPGVTRDSRAIVIFRDSGGTGIHCIGYDGSQARVVHELLAVAKQVGEDAGIPVDIMSYSRN